MKNKLIIVFLLISFVPISSFSQNETKRDTTLVDSTRTNSIMFDKQNGYKTTQTVPKAYSYDRLGMFCKLDVILQRKNKINIHFRLPSKN